MAEPLFTFSTLSSLYAFGSGLSFGTSGIRTLEPGEESVRRDSELASIRAEIALLERQLLAEGSPPSPPGEPPEVSGPPGPAPPGLPPIAPWGPRARDLPAHPGDVGAPYETLPPMPWPAPLEPFIPPHLRLPPREPVPYEELEPEEQEYRQDTLCLDRGIDPESEECTEYVEYFYGALEKVQAEPRLAFSGGLVQAARLIATALARAALRGRPAPPPPAEPEPQVGELELPEPEEVPKELEREAERAAELGRPLRLGVTRAVGVRIPRPAPAVDRPARPIVEPRARPVPQQMPAPGLGRAPQIGAGQVAPLTLPRPPVPQASRLALLAGVAAGTISLAALARPSTSLPRFQPSRAPRVRPRADAPTRVPTLRPGVTPAPTPFAQGAPARARQQECVEVKRLRRRKGKCREGFFRETSLGTRYVTWRSKPCP